MSTGIALDIGSSGFRAWAVDLDTGGVLAGSCTTCHPLPGGNVIDHILFALTYGQDLAHAIVVNAVNRLLKDISRQGDIELIAACGNPIQMALFTGGELRDLAYSSDSLERKGIAVPSRDARIVEAEDIGMGAACDVLIPPSIKAEVGADAVAMIMKSGVLKERLAVAVDLGTNAEMALKTGSHIFVGSAAAGPAIEGQHICHGMLAAPGAICDLEYDWGWKCKVLDEHMASVDGDTVDLAGGMAIKKGAIRAAGITGTGVIALVSVGLSTGYIDSPRISGGKFSLQDGIVFSEADLREAGKAFGAIRAGQRTLAVRAGVSMEAVHACFMAGASGTFVDPYKARSLGLIPPNAKTVFQAGNTSLEMAADLVSGRATLGAMQRIADGAEHVSLSASEEFKKNYLLEYAYWCEGARYAAVTPGPAMSVTRRPEIRPDSLMKYYHPAYYVGMPSVSDWKCTRACPKKALTAREGFYEVALGKCLGVSCLRCEHACPGFSLGAYRDVPARSGRAP